MVLFKPAASNPQAIRRPQLTPALQRVHARTCRRPAPTPAPESPIKSGYRTPRIAPFLPTHFLEEPKDLPLVRTGDPGNSGRRTCICREVGWLFILFRRHHVRRTASVLGSGVVVLSIALASLSAQTAMKPAAPSAMQTAVFAGGCFWGVEAVFEHLKGVKTVVSGYAGGKVVNPDYENVSSGRTGHAEAVKVTFDPSVVSYETLLKVFFTVAHDPTELNRQGPDVGTQYRSAVFFASAEQQKTVTEVIAQMTAAKATRCRWSSRSRSSERSSR